MSVECLRLMFVLIVQAVCVIQRYRIDGYVVTTVAKHKGVLRRRVETV